MSELVTLKCSCGKEFVATVHGQRAGRKWCSGPCMDRNTPFGMNRARYLREQRAARKAAEAQ